MVARTTSPDPPPLEGLRAYWEMAADGAVLLAPDGAVVAANPVAAALLDRSAADLLGRSVAEVAGDEVAAVVRRGRRWEGEVEIEVDGGLRSFDVRVRPLRDGCLLLIADLSEAGHANAERARAVRADAARARTLRLVVHDLGGPLTVINGYLAMLDEGTITLTRMRPILPVLIDNLRQMSDLVDLLLDAARVDDGRLEFERRRLALEQLLAATVEHLPAWTRSRTIEVDVKDADLEVEVDRVRLGGVIRNLLVNALKYSPEDAVVRCVVRRAGDTALIEVVDSGRGIDAAAMRRLFTRFGRLLPIRGSGPAGIGLGLYLGRELARLHGGDLTAESEEGRGTTFRLVLPLAP